jgi:hypothetical protein
MGLKTFAVLMLAFNIAFIAPETIRWAIDWILPQSWRTQPTMKIPAVSAPSIVRQDTSAKQTTAAIRAKNRG